MRIHIDNPMYHFPADACPLSEHAEHAPRMGSAWIGQRKHPASSRRFKHQRPPCGLMRSVPSAAAHHEQGTVYRKPWPLPSGRSGGSHREPLAQVRLFLDVVGDGDRQVGHADAGRLFAVHQQLIAAQAVAAGAFLAEAGLGSQPCRRRDHRPVQVLALPEHVVDNEDRDDGDGRGGEEPAVVGTVAAVERGQADCEDLFVLAVHHQVGPQVVLPGPQELEDRERGDGVAAHRQHDLVEDVDLAGAVDAGGLEDRVGDVSHRLAEHEDAEPAQRGREDERDVVIAQPPVGEHRVARDDGDRPRDHHSGEDEEKMAWRPRNRYLART